MALKAIIATYMLYSVIYRRGKKTHRTIRSPQLQTMTTKNPNIKTVLRHYLKLATLTEK